MAPSSRHSGRFGDGKSALMGVGQLWARRGSGQVVQAGVRALGTMTWVWTWPEGHLAPGHLAGWPGASQEVVDHQRTKGFEYPAPKSRIMQAGRPYWILPRGIPFYWHLTTWFRSLSQVGAGPRSSEMSQLVAQGWEDAVSPSHSFCRPLDQQVEQLSPSPGSHFPFLPSFSSLTKDHRKRPKYNKLLVSTWAPSPP